VTPKAYKPKVNIKKNKPHIIQLFVLNDMNKLMSKKPV
tara:strand:- start:7618 stop:7731 length:114 start_codon:yes stop_codon:yes gene_type:complete